MANNGPQLGMNMILAYNSGNYASPTWVTFGMAKDVTKSLKRSEADQSIRGASGWGYDAATLLKAEFKANSLYNPSDAAWNYVYNSILNNVPLEIAVADGTIATNTTTYIRATVNVMSAEEKQPLEGVVETEFSLKPTYSANPPSVVNA